MPIYKCPHCDCESEAATMQKRRSENRYQARRSPAPLKSGRHRLWQCMRQLRRFTHRDLAATAECHPNAAAMYVLALAKAGYARSVANSNGEPGSYKVFQLIKDTGPHAPRHQKGRKAIYDANLDQEVPFV